MQKEQIMLLIGHIALQKKMAVSTGLVLRIYLFDDFPKSATFANYKQVKVLAKPLLLRSLKFENLNVVLLIQYCLSIDLCIFALLPKSHWS